VQAVQTAKEDSDAEDLDQTAIQDREAVEATIENQDALHHRREMQNILEACFGDRGGMPEDHAQVLCNEVFYFYNL